MAILASNVNGVAGKWNPYYYKPFVLGRVDDGTVHITQIERGADGTIKNGVCNSSHNCEFYYIVTFKNTSTDAFIVKKYDLNDNLVDTIEASEGYNWDLSGGTGLVTIDIGVSIYFGSATTAEADDSYKITLPSFDAMERRKIYHGGYSTFMRMPHFEEVSVHSDIIPCNLKNKSITVSFNPPVLDYGASFALEGCHSEEDAAGNYAVSAMLEWNINPDGANSNVAVGTYGWHADETWSLGSEAVHDVSPVLDFPMHSQLPASDLATSSRVSGTGQTQNVQVAGRAGHAKFRLEYEEGSGGSALMAYNQFWPVILTIG